MKITYIEPYLGFSHKHWIESYKKFSRHDIEIVGLPARHWKWRMHGGAISLADKMEEKEAPDLFLVSGMIDLPLFKSLLPLEMRAIPTVLYFHENQFAYPQSDYQDGKRNEHFSFINMKSALVADKVYFNSDYNLTSFMTGSQNLIKKMPDFAEKSWLNIIENKSQVLHLGMEFLSPKSFEKEMEPPLILWNHRWEYDKNPELFFETLFRLDEEKVPFSLAVLGESFRTSPKIFEEAKNRLSHKISYWGFQERDKYEEIVGRSAYLPVTSNQDFFGISVIEAVAAGVVPILPKRLAYPEHFNEDFFFDSDEGFYQMLKESLLTPSLLKDGVAQDLRRYSWELMAPSYDEEFLKF